LITPIFIFWDFTDYISVIHALFVFNGVHEVAALSFTDFYFLGFHRLFFDFTDFIFSLFTANRKLSTANSPIPPAMNCEP